MANIQSDKSRNEIRRGKFMNTLDFDFDLPEHLIAQHPLSDRASSRMLVMHKKSHTLEHKYFRDIVDYLQKGDCLVLNDTRVLPARLFGVKESTGARIEMLLLHEETEDTWETLVKPSRKISKGDSVSFGEGMIRATCIATGNQGSRTFRLTYEGIFLEVLEKLGTMPLPPYIQETLEDEDRYQTVYAKHHGSAAAPTAGLHFTDELLSDITAKGVHIAYITLHVGLGTFRPVQVDDIEEHTMHSEYYQVNEETATLLQNVKDQGGRIIAVGTTSTRTLESCVQQSGGKFTASSGWTDIFIYPPYTFQAIDGMITNFHLPKSTLIMLVSALTSKEKTLHAYEEAVKESYRFFSFGDAMCILP